MYTPHARHSRRRSGLIAGIASASLLGLIVAGPFAGSAVAAGHSVLIVDSASVGYAFSPSTITIHAGDRVTWTNKSKAPHNVVFTKLGTGSNDLGTGGTYGHTFTKAGTYGYLCTIHYFAGTVVVQGTSTGGTPKPTARPTPKPTPKPTLRPTAEPTETPEDTPTASPTPEPTTAPAGTDDPGSSVAASPSASATQPAIALGSAGAAPGSTSPPTEPASAASGPPVGILAGLLVLVVAVVAGLRLRR